MRADWLPSDPKAMVRLVMLLQIIDPAIHLSRPKVALSEIERASKFSGHSLRVGLASSVEVDERYVQKQLDHASPAAGSLPCESNQGISALVSKFLLQSKNVSGDFNAEFLAYRFI